MPKTVKPEFENLTGSSADLAGLLNISRRRVQQLAKDGVIPAPIKYKYALAACVRAYASFLQDSVKQTGSGSSDADIKKARIDLMRSQKRNADLIHAEKKGQLIRLDFAESLMLEAASVLVGALTSFTPRIAGTLANLDDPKKILRLMDEEIRGVRQAVSDALGEARRRLPPTNSSE